MEMILSFLKEEYLIFGGCLALLALLSIDATLTKESRRQAIIMISLVVTLSVSTFIEHYSRHVVDELHINIRFTFATICYLLRPLLLEEMLFHTAKPSKRNKFIMRLPFRVLAVFYLINIFHPWIFIINEQNEWVGLNHHNLLSLYVCCIYMTLWIIEIIKRYLRTRQRIYYISFLVYLIIASAAAIDVFTNDYNLNMASLIALILDYLGRYVFMSNKLIKAKESELQDKKNALMISQIQPHFLYNTLNVIYRLCQINPLKAGETTLKFSDYLRNNINFSNTEEKLIPIEKEIEHTKMYSDIERLRFSKLTIDYNILDTAFSLPPLTIQPMVENAIRHGVRGQKDGHITVSTFYKDNIHHVVIEDNGIGAVVNNQNLGSHSGIGITNVRERLESLCDASLEINMTPGIGTKVIIKIK